MRVWRVCSDEYARHPYDGEGGLYASARWHHKGRRIVYTAQSLELAVLELFVNLSSKPIGSFVWVAAHIPDSISVSAVAVSQLPSDWAKHPAPPVLQDIGTAWLQSGSSLVLRVPSAVIPAAWNYLLNPEHADFTKVTVHAAEPFQFDPRMWK